MPYILALYAKQFLEIKHFTFDYHENKSQRQTIQFFWSVFIKKNIQ